MSRIKKLKSDYESGRAKSFYETASVRKAAGDINKRNTEIEQALEEISSEPRHLAKAKPAEILQAEPVQTPGSILIGPFDLTQCYKQRVSCVMIQIPQNIPQLLNNKKEAK